MVCVCLFPVCERSRVKILQSPVSRARCPLKNFLQKLTPVGSAERAIQVQLQFYSCCKSDRLEEIEHFSHFYRLYQVL